MHLVIGSNKYAVFRHWFSRLIVTWRQKSCFLLFLFPSLLLDPFLSPYVLLDSVSNFRKVYGLFVTRLELHLLLELVRFWRHFLLLSLNWGSIEYLRLLPPNPNVVDIVIRVHERLRSGVFKTNSLGSQFVRKIPALWIGDLLSIITSNRLDFTWSAINLSNVALRWEQSVCTTFEHALPRIKYLRIVHTRLCSVAHITLRADRDSTVQCIASILRRLHIHVILIPEPGYECLTAHVIAKFLLLFLVRSFHHECTLLVQWALAHRFLGRLIEMIKATIFTWRVEIMLISNQADSDSTVGSCPVEVVFEAFPSSLIKGMLFPRSQLFLGDSWLIWNHALYLFRFIRFTLTVLCWRFWQVSSCQMFGIADFINVIINDPCSYSIEASNSTALLRHHIAGFRAVALGILFDWARIWDLSGHCFQP